MTSSVRQAREALGHRLRDLRRDARLTGAGLAAAAGWPGSKVSKIEHGKQLPTEDDIRAWCRHTGAKTEVADLIATVRNVEAMYSEWRRSLGTGTKRRQRAVRELEARTRLMRWYEPALVPGILHTVEYAEAVLRRVIDFYGVPNDVMAGVTERMERQQTLYKGDHRFHFVLAQQALLTTVGDDRVMAGQLDRLLTVASLPRITLAVIPAAAAYHVPTNQFIMFDDRVVYVETISAELTINQPREVALYGKAFDALTRLAVTGEAARVFVKAALNSRIRAISDCAGR